MANTASDGAGKVRRISLPLPARSNAGGAVRGQARAAQVQALNRSGAKGLSLPKRKAEQKRSKSATPAERARAANRREVFAALDRSPAAKASAAASASEPKDAGIGDIYGSLTKAGNTLKRTR